jgi:excisionase family DNA binding protein
LSYDKLPASIRLSIEEDDMDAADYTVRVELDSHDDLGQDVVAALAAYRPVAGRGPRGHAEVSLTVPADGVVQATQTAVGVVLQAMSSHGPPVPVLAVEVLPADERVRRSGLQPLPPLVSVPDAGALLGISRQAVLQRIESGSLPATRVGRTYAIQRAALATEPRPAPRAGALAALAAEWDGRGRWPEDDAPGPRDRRPDPLDPLPMPPGATTPGGGGLG